MRQSLFRRVTRYTPGASLDPRENRLTEATAAVLERVDGLAHAVASALLESACTDDPAAPLDTEESIRRRELYADCRRLRDPRVSVRTQVATPRGRFVDLELLLRPPGRGGRGVLLWVEVKYGAGLHGDQLDAYVEEIETAHPVAEVGRLVIVLAPRNSTAGLRAVTGRVAVTSWQQLAVTIAAFDGGSLPDEQRFLLSEYLSYLREEGLMDPDRLTASSALALMEANTAGAAAAAICEVADRWIAARWGERGTHLTAAGRAALPAFGLRYWAHHAPHPTGVHGGLELNGAWLEWGLRNTRELDYLDEARGSWAFIAGITVTGKAQAHGDPAWMARMISSGFSFVWIGGWYRMVRLKYPDELLSAATLEAQGELLGRWVVDAFETIAEDPPRAVALQ
ncbi:hypothetical protein [Conexibacter arvalis]|uniref:PD-(D/E)XK nuclease superfamily protein n=1 Tax=Conexibacter arvalis TaxID=912552 RepID=A0A840I6C3_9ACTN|nr:hypothetical protein [Conexibacter arvalis]MBB4660476.1 hypothetical protein [Conexibacter arvalis]